LAVKTVLASVQTDDDQAIDFTCVDNIFILFLELEQRPATEAKVLTVSVVKELPLLVN
jgi:hypothetical protein